MSRRTITIAGKKYIYIPGDKVSQADVIREIRQHKESFYRYQMEQIRTNDELSPDIKKLRTDELRWKLLQLQRENEG